MFKKILVAGALLASGVLLSLILVTMFDPDITIF
ncbi:hypothetical protein HNR39_000540 [Glaciimonas immobilis]|uniref:Uncharacterized protein n=1 Tax=Glaciimonas immobilis TaxID=728004 RepID=A0A840RQ35_9BURK|nr:hypothetical protein [Glaciimonas immobilis]